MMLSKTGRMLTRSCYILVLTVFSWCNAGQYNFSVPEEQPPGYHVGMFPGNGYSVIGVNTDFAVSSDGRVTTLKKFDRETMGVDKLDLVVLHSGRPSVADIYITDINDNVPKFPIGGVTKQIIESTKKGHRMSLRPATDPDLGNNASVVYKIVSGNTDNHFFLKMSSGGLKSVELVVNGTLDRETTPKYTLNISACDQGNPVLCGYCLVQVILEDSNDNAPVFNPTRYNGNITENAIPGTSIVKVYATDPDLGTNAAVSFSIGSSSDPGGLFSITSEGVLSNNFKLDYEQRKDYQIVVVAKDSGTSPKTSIAHVNIHVLDINDNDPSLTVTYSNQQGPQVLEGAQNGTAVAYISATDKDSGINGEVIVTMGKGNEYFSLVRQASPPTVYNLVVRKLIDRETTPTIVIQVDATDKGTPPKTAQKTVTLTVGDVNDNTPVFKNTPYATIVNESVPTTQSIFVVKATDADLGTNAKITYSIVNNPPYSGWFSINANTGDTFATRKIDREINPSATITIKATDNGTPAKFATEVITFTITDANDNPPVFNKADYVFTAVENSTSLQNVGAVSATDRDTSIFLPIRYSLQGTSYFQMNSVTGQITTSHVFDREIKGIEKFSVFATDNGGLQGTAQVSVNISDINDNSPYFIKTFYNISIRENIPPGVPVEHIVAKDLDIGENGRIIYKLESCEPCNMFHINNRTGGLSTTSNLDHSKQNIYKFSISCQDAKGFKSTNKASVIVNVLPAVKKVPRFKLASYVFNFAENKPIGSTVGSVTAKRDGIDTVEFMEYKFLSADVNKAFKINYTGGITNMKIIDHEAQKNFSTIVTVKVFGTNLTASTNVSILIQDLNDNTPNFNASSFSLNLKEGVPLGYQVFNAKAMDPDSGDNGRVTYSFQKASQYFKIDATTAVISTKNVIDFEAVKEFSLVVVAVDHGTPPNRATLSLKINVTDINDNPPQFSMSSYFTSVSESAPVGFHIFTLNVTDADSGQNGEFTLSFKTTKYSGMFSLMNNGKVTVAKKLDRETTTDYTLTVTARDKVYPQHTAKATLTIIVTDVNDNVPNFGMKSFALSVCEEQPPGTFVKSISAVDKDEGSNGLISYKFQPVSPYFEINSVTGAIKTKAKFDREKSAQIYNLVVNATDSGSPSKSSLVDVIISVCDINDNAPVFNKASPYVVSIRKSVAPNTNILQVQATDSDQESAAVIEYSLVGMFDESNSVDKFSIDKTSGWIKTVSSFASDTQRMHKFSVVAKDKGIPRMVSVQKIIVFLLDGNGQKQLFLSYYQTILLPENSPVNQTVYTSKVAPEYIGGGKVWEYSIIDGNKEGRFSINKASGEIRIKTQLSYELAKSFQLRINAKDIRNIDARIGRMFLNIFVLDRNQELPIFASNPIIHGVNENLPQGSIIYQATATDNDFEDNGKVLYSIVSQGPGTAMFDIGPFTGKIKTTRPIDREKVSQWTLIIKAEDIAINSSARHSTTVTMKLLIFDLNDNKPEFISSNYTYMMEDERIGYPVMRIVARDFDQGDNAKIQYAIKSGNQRGKFKIESTTGEITLIRKLTFNEQSSYALTIEASDKGSPRLASTQNLRVEIIDVNNNSPRFQKRTFIANVTEGKPVGTKVLRVKATDSDAGSNAKIIYNLEVNSHFVIDSSTGWISTKREIDREQWASYKLSITADNDVWPFQSDTATVIINVDDINDCPPVFLDGSIINLTVFENSKTFVHRFVASDCDTGTNAHMHYAIVQGDTTKFSVVASTGLLYTSVELDRENRAMYELKIRAKDTAWPYQAVNQTAKIWVGDLNDNTPKFTKNSYAVTVPENAPRNSTVMWIKATDLDALPSGQVVYSVIRNKTSIPFEIDANTGKLYVNGPLDYETKRKYTFKVRASDLADYGSLSNVTTVVVRISDYNDNAPVFPSPIFEGNTTNSIIVHATDKDSNNNGIVRYRFVHSNSMFAINSQTGVVTLRNPNVGRYRLKVEAYDLGTPSLSSTTTLIINVGSQSLLMPRFLNKSASIQIPENSEENFVVGKMIARSSSSSVRYSIESNAHISGSKVPFKIDPSTGVVSVNSPVLLDYERKKSFEIVVRASINGNDTLSTYEKLKINLTDLNDNSPVIYPRNHDISLPEAAQGENQVNLFVKQFGAMDADSGRNGEIDSITISSGNEDGVFDMHSSGILILKKNLDYEKKKIHRLEIKAKDGGMPPRYRTTRFTVHVIDINDNPPVFGRYGSQRISEDASPGSLICIVKATDPDKSSKIRYSIKTDEEIETYFYIDPIQGLIKLLGKLDYETRKQFKLVIEASDNKYKSTMTLTINVEDTNDNAPVFSRPGYDVYLPEIVPVNHPIVKLNATDKDSGAYGQVRYSIPYPPIDAFLMNQNTGLITATRSITLNARNPPYNLLVVASDGGNPPRQTQTRVHLRVKDPNYAGPEFDKKKYPMTSRAFENYPIGALIATVSVSDKSNVPGMQVEYSIAAGNHDGRFYIDPLNGKIQLVAVLDRENVSRYQLTVRATDRSTPPQYAEAQVNVIIVDANDNAPVFEKKEYVVNVKENISSGTVLVQVNATDKDEKGPKIGNGIIDKYEITSGNSLNWFEIDKNTGVITLIRLLDRESTPVHRLTVTATDKGDENVKLKGYTSVIIKLEDVNDNTPDLAIPNIEDLKVLENSKGGTLVFKATAEDRDQGPNGVVTYSIIDGNGRDFFEIDNATGWVKTKSNKLDYESKKFYVLRILAVDHGKPPLSSTQEYRIAVQDVNDHFPQFVQQKYQFAVKGSAKIGTKIGTVNATDQDGGSWSKIRYTMADTDKLRVISDTGDIIVNKDLRKRVVQQKRKRRSTDSGTFSFIITADNGPNTTGQSVRLALTVDYSCPGCVFYVAPTTTHKPGVLTGVPLILVTVFGTIFGLLLIAVLVFILRRRKSRNEAKEEKPVNVKPPLEVVAKPEECPTAPENDFHQPAVGFEGYHPHLYKQPSVGGASSGRGSTASQLLSGSRRPSFTGSDNGSTHSFVVYHDNKPVLDSGIVGDFDRLSDVTLSDIAPSSDIHYAHKAEVASSVGSSFGRRNEVSSSLSRKLRRHVEYSTQSDSHDSLNDFMDEGGGEAAGRLDFGNLLYTKLAEVDADEHEAVMDGTRPFMDEGAPSRGGSLSTIVGSDEEMKGSYNWDYLLDWGPQYKPVASVFSEIARMKGAEGGNLPMQPRDPSLQQRDPSMQERVAQMTQQPQSNDRMQVQQQAMQGKPIPLQNLSQKMPLRQSRSSELSKPIPLQTLTKKAQMDAAESIDSKADSTRPNIPRGEVNQSNLISNRTSMLSSFSSLPHSPLSAQSSYTSGPLSPNFTPAITPLITRSPSVSPLETPGIASPMDSKPESVLDLAEKSRKSRSSGGSRRSDKITLSDNSSQLEVHV